MEGISGLHAEVERLRKRQDLELQQLMRQVEEETAKVVKEGEGYPWRMMGISPLPFN